MQKHLFYNHYKSNVGNSKELWGNIYKKKKLFGAFQPLDHFERLLKLLSRPQTPEVFVMSKK